MFESSAEKSTLTLKSATAGGDHLFDDISHASAETASIGDTAGTLAGCALIGGTATVASRLMARVPEHAAALLTNREVTNMLGTAVVGGFVRGAALAAADAGAGMLLQRTIGHNIMGHDLFKPTAVELLGMGVAAAVPCDMRIKVGVGALSWLAGRVENYFDFPERFLTEQGHL